MTVTANRQRFRRTDIPWIEKTIGGVILILLIGIGYSIYHLGQHYDASRYQVETHTLQSTRESPDLPSLVSSNKELVSEDFGEGYAADYNSDHSGDTAVIASATIGRSFLEDTDLFPGFREMGETEYYDPDTLYVKINGRAPAYLGFNFQSLASRTFSIVDAPGQYLDVFLYTMDTPVNAFGIFSMEREAGAPVVDFVSQGYQSAMGYFFRQGNVYVQVIASDTAEPVIRAAENCARIIANQLPEDDAGVEAASILPGDGMIPGSLSYIQENAYGLALLNNIFEARYEVEGNELSFFAMKSSPNTAAEAYASVKQFFTDYGTVADEMNIGDASVFTSESFGQYSVIFLNGDELGGVINADDQLAAQSFVTSFLNQSP